MTRASLQRFLPPLCLLIALGMLVVAFSLLAVGAPEATVDLHQARASADETFLQTYRRLGLAPFKAVLYPPSDTAEDKADAA